MLFPPTSPKAWKDLHSNVSQRIGTPVQKYKCKVGPPLFPFFNAPLQSIIVIVVESSTRLTWLRSEGSSLLTASLVARSTCDIPSPSAI